MSASQGSLSAPSRPPPSEDPLVGSAVLVVDDEPGMRSFLARALARRGVRVEAAADADEAEALGARRSFDLLLVDNRLPGRSGVQWVEELKAQGLGADVVLMTAYADLDTAIAAVRVGAADFLLKPFHLEQVMTVIERALEGRRLARENFVLRRQVSDRDLDGVIAVSTAMREVCALVRRAAPTAATVLIEGETGTGKELVARALHALSGRRGAFVPVNCGSISPELLESELFGHIRGAFTGAHQSREGLFSYAQGGTLFLDEIGEMPLAMQAKLLRALEEKAVRPVGSDRHNSVDVRVIAATNHHLSHDVHEGRFREDLYFRLSVLVISIPPLRERVDDIPPLVEHLSESLGDELGARRLELSRGDLAKLERYSWPGNVRELRNVLERALLLGKLPEDCLQPATQAAGDAQGGADTPLDWTLAELERHHALRVLADSGGNKSLAARRLGISRKTLERRLKQWRRGSAGLSRR